MRKSQSVLRIMMAILVLTGTILPIAAGETPIKDARYEVLRDRLIEAEIDYGLTGAQLVVLKDGVTVTSKAYGYTNAFETIYDENGEVVLDDIRVLPKSERHPITQTTVFDLASNTKMYAGNFAIQYLISQNKLTLDTKVVDIFPTYQYQGVGVDGQQLLTVGHLLRHDSGFIASPKYHDNTFTGNLGNGDHPENYLYSQTEAEMLDRLLITPLEFMPGEKVRYSDVDFMLLGKIVEAVSGERFDVFLKNHIYDPLGASSVMFNPLTHGIAPESIASTELHGNTRDGRVHFNNERHEILTGTVHDEKAYYSFQGVAGHAGLFGNATDIASLAQLMLEKGTRDNVEYFSQKTIEDFSKPSILNDTYAYGWRRQGNDKAYDWAFSPYASVDTLGHTGWTGTLTQVDPDNGIVIVLLTNARNSPIMGPGKNDFFTKSFRTNDYGTITTLIYESLGLGDKPEPLDYILGLIEKDAKRGLTTSSQRNEMRALLTVLTAYNEDLGFDTIYQSETIQDIIKILNDNHDVDLRFIDTTSFDAVNKEGLTQIIEESDDVELVALSKNVFNDTTARQTFIDSVVARFEPKPNNTLDWTAYDALLATFEGVERGRYTETSLDCFDARIKSLHQKAEAITMQVEIDALVNEFYDVTSCLVEKNDTQDSDLNVSTDLNTLPKTGIGVDMGIYMGYILVGGGLFTLRRKYK